MGKEWAGKPSQTGIPDLQPAIAQVRGAADLGYVL